MLLLLLLGFFVWLCFWVFFPSHSHLRRVCELSGGFGLPCRKDRGSQVSLGTRHTTGGSCRSRGGSKCLKPPPAMLWFMSFSLLHCKFQVFCQMAQVPGGMDGEGARSVCECMSELSLCPVWWLLCTGGTDDSKQGKLAMPQQLCSGTSFPNCSVKLILLF